MNVKMLALRAFAASALLWGCGKLVDMGRDGTDGLERRVYVNDVAPNESLPSVIVGPGVYFVMHPGKQYQLRVKSASAGEQLQVMRLNGNRYYSWKAFPAPAAAADSAQVYALQPDEGDMTRIYRAFLRSGTGDTTSRPQSVRFFSVPQLANALQVKLILVGPMTHLSDADKPAFAQAVLDSLAALYGGYGITVTGSYEIVDPAGERFVADFGAQSGFPGTRVANTAHLYMVDNITYKGEENEDLLGFAPREGLDLLTNVVVLNSRGAGTSARGTPAQRAASVVATAAHELGHLFGLRHTTASAEDRTQDFDKSNTHDGFPSTPYCGPALSKRAALDGVYSDVESPDGTQFCLRTAATHSCACQDVGNLMFAYQCQVTGGQRTLAAEQRVSCVRTSICSSREDGASLRPVTPARGAGGCRRGRRRPGCGPEPFSRAAPDT